MEELDNLPDSIARESSPDRPEGNLTRGVETKAHMSRYIMTTQELARLTGESSHRLAQSLGRNELLRLPNGKPGVPPLRLREFLEARGADYSFKVVAHVNLRGGIGKTISSITLATRAVQYGFKTCILDLDSQGSASLAFGKLPGEDDPIFYDVWQRPTEMLPGALQRIEDQLFILPSSLENGLLDINMINPSAQKNAVRGVCAELKANHFDLVVIDCPPSLGTAVISTICAADIIVIPVASDAFSFRGLEITLNEISSICQTFSIRPPQIRILYTKFDRRIKISHDAAARLKTNYARYLIPIYIRTSTDFLKALERGETVFAHSQKSHAKDDYDLYVRSLLHLDSALAGEEDD